MKDHIMKWYLSTEDHQFLWKYYCWPKNAEICCPPSQVQAQDPFWGTPNLKDM